MPTDFSVLAKHARLNLAVPTLDIGAIRARSSASGARECLRRLAAATAIALCAGGAAAAFAGTAGGWHLWLFGNKVEVAVQSLAIVREPMAADARAVVKRAAFPMMLPDGLPRELRVLGIAYSPIERPTLLTVQYGNGSNAWAMSVSLI
jgi:hypothetical protein